MALLTHNLNRPATQRLSCLLLGFSLAFAAFAAAPERAQTEAEVKADYLFIFSKYVDWPAGTFTTTNQPLVIGVIGDGAIAQALERRAAGRLSQDGRTVTVLQAARAADLNGCQMVFIGRPERHRLREITQVLGGKPVLTVCDSDDLFDQDLTVKFVLSEGRVRFEVKLESAQGAGLRIHSGMLASALKVWRPPLAPAPSRSDSHGSTHQKPQ